MTEVLLKARPTRAQLADRLSAPVPPGLELYLDARDVADRERLERLAQRLNDLRPTPDFVYVVEGPLRSIDGAFFDVSRNGPAQRECVRRLAWLAAEIGAEAVLIHAIAPRKLHPVLTEEMHTATLEASLPFIEYYVAEVKSQGLIPMLENIPPVARQREAAYMCTPIGMRAGDLVYFADRFPGLKVTVDVSHAQLFLNGMRLGARGDTKQDRQDIVDVEEWRLQPVKGQRLQPGLDTSVGVQGQRMQEASLPDPLKRRFQGEAVGRRFQGEAVGRRFQEREDDRLKPPLLESESYLVHPSTSCPSCEVGELGPLVRYLGSLPDEPTMEAYLSQLDPYLFEAHISNARGLLDEGLPYADGDLDMDSLAVRLSRSCKYLVTETIEPDADRGTYMREAQSRLEATLRRTGGREQDRQDADG